jgi:hypothetical protein
MVLSQPICHARMPRDTKACMEKRTNGACFASACVDSWEVRRGWRDSRYCGGSTGEGTERGF